MNHPLVRTTEAFLVKHLQLSGAGASSSKNTVTGGKSGKNKREGGKGGQRQDGKSETNADKDRASAGKGVEPNVVLFISLSGGKRAILGSAPKTRYFIW